MISGPKPGGRKGVELTLGRGPVLQRRARQQTNTSSTDEEGNEALTSVSAVDENLSCVQSNSRLMVLGWLGTRLTSRRSVGASPRPRRQSTREVLCMVECKRGERSVADT